MIGISSLSKDKIASIIENMFDNIALSLLGNIPRLKNKKMMIFSTQPNLGLAHLFIQAMQNKMPNSIEQDVLKGLLSSADGYIEALKHKTKTNLAERIDGLVKDAKMRGDKVTAKDVEETIKNEMNKAKSHMQSITESEATKLRNLGTLMDITRVASSLGDTDPTVFFVIVRDGVTCKECVRLHLMPDQVTPRLYKFSELKQGYHKRGDNVPSAFGLHPHCRCTLTYLSRGFNFDQSGKLQYRSENWDAYSAQRK